MNYTSLKSFGVLRLLLTGASNSAMDPGDCEADVSFAFSFAFLSHEYTSPQPCCACIYLPVLVVRATCTLYRQRT